MKSQRLGPYIIEDRLGEGGMGTVYRGRHQDTGQVVAVKVLLPGMSRREGFRARFDAEIESLRKLNHPNIVRLYGFGEHDENLFYSMELVEGESLDSILEKGRRFDWQQTINMGRQICQALRHAHDRGIIHRDLKPANLIMTSDGTLKLADFGIARLWGVTGLTVDGGIVGTATYMPPEQVEGLKITARSDLYSLGCVLYALLAGRPPFKAKSLPQMLRMQVSQEPEPVRTHAPHAPVELEVIIRRLLAKAPQDRIANARVLERSLTMAEAAIRLRSGDHPATPADEDSPSRPPAAASNLKPPTAGTGQVSDPTTEESLASAAHLLHRSAKMLADQKDSEEQQTLVRRQIMSDVVAELEQNDSADYAMKMSDPGSAAADEGDVVEAAEASEADLTVDNPSHRPAAPAGHTQSRVGDNTFWPKDDEDLAGPDHLMPQDARHEPLPTGGDFFTAEFADDAGSEDAHPEPHAPAPGRALQEPVPAIDDEWRASHGPSISGTIDEARQAADGTLFVTVEEANRIEAQQKARELADREPPSPVVLRVASIVLLVAAAGIVTWFFRPLDADGLYERAVFKASSGSTEQLLAAELDIRDFLRMHPEDDRGDELQQYLDEIEVINLERKMRVRSRRMNADSSQLPVEQAYLQALQVARTDPEQGVKQMDAIIAVFSDPHASEREETEKYVALAQRQRDNLKEQISAYAAAHMLHARKRLRDAELMQQSNPREARAICEGLITLYDGKPWAGSIIERTRQVLRALPLATRLSPQPPADQRDGQVSDAAAPEAVDAGAGDAVDAAVVPPSASRAAAAP